MKKVLLILLLLACVGLKPVKSQQLKMDWTHIYKKSGTELIITRFDATADSVLLQYECSPDSVDYLESRSRPLIHGSVTDTTYISCPDIVKITAQTIDSTLVDYVPQQMLRRLTKEENPDWFN